MEQAHSGPAAAAPTWRTVPEAALYLRVGVKLIYREARAGRLRHARIGNRRDLRFRVEWLDQYLDATAAPVEVRR
jgi:excisionase family DNA binding protein